MIGKIVAGTLAAAVVTAVVASAPDIKRYIRIRGM
jgi:hypothetical protein